jgi:hypothetical protein
MGIGRELVVLDLCRDEKLRTLQARRCDRRADGGFILIHGGRIDMAEAERDGALHHRHRLSARHPERAEAEAGDVDPPCVLIVPMMAFLSQIVPRDEASDSLDARRDEDFRELSAIVLVMLFSQGVYSQQHEPGCESASKRDPSKSFA